MVKVTLNEGDECCCACCAAAALLMLLNSDANSATLESRVSHTSAKEYVLSRIDDYQTRIGPDLKEILGKDKICKYTPTCSEYGRQAVEKYGALKGGLLAAKRIAKCNPLSKGGEDPLL